MRASWKLWSCVVVAAAAVLIAGAGWALAASTNALPVNAQIVANFAQFRRARTAADVLPASIKLTVRYCSGPFSEGGPKYASIFGLAAWYQIQCSSLPAAGSGLARRPALRQFIDGLQRDQSRAVRLPGRLGTVWLIPSGRWLCDLLRFGASFRGPPPPGFPPGGGISWSAACEPISEALARPPLWPGGIWGEPRASGGDLFALEPDQVTKATLGYYPSGTQRTYLAHNVLGACIGHGSSWLVQTGPTISGAIKTLLGGGNLNGRPARYRPGKCPLLP